MYLALDLPVAPGQEDGGSDRVCVAEESIAESADFRQPRSVCACKPVLKSVLLPGAEDVGKPLCQFKQNGNLRAAFIQLEEQLLLIWLQLFWPSILRLSKVLPGGHSTVDRYQRAERQPRGSHNDC